MRYAVALASVLTIAGCSCSSKPPAAKETGSATQPVEVVSVPGGAKGAEGAPNFAGSGSAAATGIGGANALHPEEGTLAIQAPSDAKPGAEATAKIVITPATSYHVNTEFPVKLELQPPAGVTLAKAQFIAGGPDKAKGDAEQFDEKQLAFAVKLTPAQAGSFTVSGTIKFAVCDKDTCLPKKEPVTIAFAAK